MENQSVTCDEVKSIRSLDDFDLVMLVSEIHDHGWPTARQTLKVMTAPRLPLGDNA
jgi:hypothetical protein